MKTPKYKKATFLGHPMAQKKAEFLFWEDFLTQRNFSRIVEIGTASGNLSLFFFLFAYQKNAGFYTFDIAQHEKSRVKDLVGFDKCFYNINVFKNPEVVTDIIRKPGMTILFCDGGNKEKEYGLFKPFLKKGDIIGLHDVGTEVDLNNLDLTDVEFITQCERSAFYKKVK